MQTSQMYCTTQSRWRRESTLSEYTARSTFCNSSRSRRSAPTARRGSGARNIARPALSRPNLCRAAHHQQKLGCLAAWALTKQSMYVAKVRCARKTRAKGSRSSQPIRRAGARPTARPSNVAAADVCRPHSPTLLDTPQARRSERVPSQSRTRSLGQWGWLTLVGLQPRRLPSLAQHSGAPTCCSPCRPARKGKTLARSACRSWTGSEFIRTRQAVRHSPRESDPRDEQGVRSLPHKARPRPRTSIGREGRAAKTELSASEMPVSSPTAASPSAAASAHSSGEPLPDVVGQALHTDLEGWKLLERTCTRRRDVLSRKTLRTCVFSFASTSHLRACVQRGRQLSYLGGGACTS